MAFTTNNGITFTPTDVTQGVKTKIQNTNNRLSKATSEDDIEFFVNAVEIDWNGAQIGEC